MSSEAKYYQNELNKINPKAEYPVSIRIFGEGVTTKTMSLNKDSAEVIVAWLKNNYLSNK